MGNIAISVTKTKKLDMLVGRNTRLSYIVVQFVHFNFFFFESWYRLPSCIDAGKLNGRKEAEYLPTRDMKGMFILLLIST